MEIAPVGKQGKVSTIGVSEYFPKPVNIINTFAI
jgi:hypothetical protein